MMQIEIKSVTFEVTDATKERDRVQLTVKPDLHGCVISMPERSPRSVVLDVADGELRVFVTDDQGDTDHGQSDSIELSK